MRWILRTFVVLVALFAAWLGIVWSGVLPRVTPEQLFNPAGCQLVARLGPPSAVAHCYAVRLGDFDRRLALARAARWWRAQPGASAGATPSWPDDFAAIRDEITIDAATRTLSVPMRDASNPQRTVFHVRY